MVEDEPPPLHPTVKEKRMEDESPPLHPTEKEKMILHPTEKEKMMVMDQIAMANSHSLSWEYGTG